MVLKYVIYGLEMYESEFKLSDPHSQEQILSLLKLLDFQLTIRNI